MGGEGVRGAFDTEGQKCLSVSMNQYNWREKLSVGLIVGGLVAGMIVMGRWEAVKEMGIAGQVRAASSPSGENMPVGNVAGWRQIFVDDFTNDVALGSFPSAVADRWFAYPSSWHDTSGNGKYYPEKVISQHDGLMDLYIHTENGVHLVSAPVPKLKNGSHSYGAGLLGGRYVIRFKADPLACYKTAWLLWPDSDTWPRDGEIDFPEGSLDKTIKAYMHRQNGTSGGDQDAYSTNATYPSWHTAVTEWQPEKNDLKFYLDGALVGHSTSRVPNTPMHWVIQTETSLSSGCVPADSTAGHVLIDWVAVYVPDSAASPTSSNEPAPTESTSPKPTDMPALCVADINEDRVVDLSDYSILAANFFRTHPSNSRADIDGDGIVDLSDYSILAANFLKTCN